MKRFLLFTVMLCGALTVSAQNPYLPLWEHLPDGEPRVFEDPDQPGKFRAYIIGSHDTHFSEYCGNDVRMWSAPVEDLTQWRDEGPIFSYFVDGRWDTMFAPDLVEVRDKTTGKKTYWLYPHSRGWRRVGMVCKSDRPDGPFTPVNLTPDGRACVEGSLIDFDPSVFVETVTDKKDPDFARGFRAYVFYGFQHSTAYQLDPDNMYAVRPGTKVIDPFIPASSHDGRLLDKEGSEYTALYKGQNPLDFNFFEASSIRQVGNKYVMVFSGYSGKEYGLGNTNSALRYAYGDSPLGPWRAGGVLVDSRGVVLNQDGSKIVTSNAAHNTHGSLQEINGQWYVFYHRPPRGYANARQAMVAPVKIEWDKKPVAKGGQVRITAYDPFAKDNVWTAKAADGNEYRGAEVTSEGFQIFGLPPYQYYSAGIACYMTGPGSNEWLTWISPASRMVASLASSTLASVVCSRHRKACPPLRVPSRAIKHSSTSTSLPVERAPSRFMSCSTAPTPPAPGMDVRLLSLKFQPMLRAIPSFSPSLWRLSKDSLASTPSTSSSKVLKSRNRNSRRAVSSLVVASSPSVRRVSSTFTDWASARTPPSRFPLTSGKGSMRSPQLTSQWTAGA